MLYASVVIESKRERERSHIYYQIHLDIKLVAREFERARLLLRLEPDYYALLLFKSKKKFARLSWLKKKKKKKQKKTGIYCFSFSFLSVISY